MKKLFAGLLAVMMLFALTACGGKTEGGESSSQTEAPKEEKQLYQGFFSAEVPEGFTFKEQMNNDCFQKNDDSSYAIKLLVSSGTAEEEAKKDAERSEHSAGEDVTIGAYTYKVVNFTWNNDTPSAKLFTDAPSAEGYCVSVTLYMMTPENPDAKTFLESLKIEDDAYNKWQEYRSSKNY